MPRALTIVEDVTEDDAVMIAQELPALTGNGDEDLYCGHCGNVLAAKLTGNAIHRMFPTQSRLILRCTCQANNFVPREDETSAP